MARVRSIERGTQKVEVHPTEVDCYYQIVSDPSGGRLVHLSTFGSDSRVSKSKSSQSIQLDSHVAEVLIGVLQEAFPSLGNQHA